MLLRSYDAINENENEGLLGFGILRIQLWNPNHLPNFISLSWVFLIINGF